MLRGIEPSDRAQVDQRELARLEHHDIAGMWVCMEDATAQNLREETTEQGTCQVHAIQTALLNDGIGLAHAAAVQPLRDQDAPAGKLFVEPGYRNLWVVLQ